MPVKRTNPWVGKGSESPSTRSGGNIGEHYGIPTCIAKNEIAISVADNGRIVLSVALRRRLKLVRGGTLMIRKEEGRLILENADEAITRAQGRCDRTSTEA